MRALCLALFAPFLLLVTACTSSLPMSVRADAEVTGKGTAGPVTLAGVPATPTYRIDGWAKVTAQFPALPYLTIEGDYSTTVTLAPNVSAAQYAPDSVLIRVPYPAQQIKGAETLPAGVVRTEAHKRPHPVKSGALTCGGGICVPGVDPEFLTSPRCADDRALVAAPTPKAANGRPCGTPIYVGCDGTAGGHAPAPGGTYKVIAPGTGWPCKAAKPAAAAASTCPGGFAAILQGIADLLSGRII